MKSSAALILAVGMCGVGQAADHKLAPELQNLNPEDTVDVIVQYRSSPAEAEHRNVVRRGGQLKHNLHIIRGAHYSIAAGRLEELANDPDVEFIAPDRLVQASAAAHNTGPDRGSPHIGWRT